MSVQLWNDTGECPMGDLFYEDRYFDDNGFLLDCELDLEGEQQTLCIEAREDW